MNILGRNKCHFGSRVYINFDVIFAPEIRLFLDPIPEIQEMGPHNKVCYMFFVTIFPASEVIDPRSSWYLWS